MINYVDVCCGLAWGDEGKGKIVSHLTNEFDYDFVCRWAGGDNAGHTIYIEGKKYKTHLIPSGIFYGKKSIIGPGCVINKDSFYKEIDYLRENGFDTSLVKISKFAHIVTNEHIQEDKEKYANTIGTTSRGIGPCYRDKYARLGKRIIDCVDDFDGFIWNGELYGNILCEGAQGFWLDIDEGNYPYVTSSCTLPYSCCNLGFPMQKIRRIYGACKMYDTRSGEDPEFPDTLFDNSELSKIGNVGKEYGTTTGRRRKVNYLDLDKLIYAIYCTGSTHLILSKGDVLEECKCFKLIFKNEIMEFDTLLAMESFIEDQLLMESNMLVDIVFSYSPEKI